MFRNRQIVKYPPLHVLRLTLTPLPIPRIQHLPFDIPNAASRLGYRFSPDGLLTRHIAIGVPVACAAGFKKFIGITSKSPCFHVVKGKYEGAEPDRHHLN